MSAFSDGFAARHTDLVHDAIQAAGDAKHSRNPSDVQIDRGRRGRRRRSGRRVCLGQRIVNGEGNRDRVAVRRYVHVENMRALAEQMVVKRRRLHTRCLQRAHDGLDFVFAEDEVAHGHHFALGNFFESDPAAQRERGFQRYAVEHNRHIRARDAEAHDVARLESTLSPERRLNGIPDGRCAGCRGLLRKRGDGNQ